MASFVTDSVPDFTPKTVDEEKKAATVARLAELVDGRWRVAVAVRALITDRMIQCRRAMEGKPISGRHLDPDLPVVLNITASIAQGLLALFTDAMTVSEAELFTLRPSAAPELPIDKQAQIMDQLRAQQAQLAQFGITMDMDTTMAAAAGLVRAAQTEAMDQANTSAQALQTDIKEDMQQNGWVIAMSEFLRDYCCNLAGILKYPSPRVRKTRKWVNGALTFIDEVVRCVERIAPEDFYLAPNATGPQPDQSEWVIELRRTNPNELVSLGISPGYDTDEVMRAIQLYPMGRIEVEDGQASFLTQPDQSTSADVNPYTRHHSYDVRCMYGRVHGSLLQDMGVIVDDPSRSYEAEICVIGECVIRATLNPDPGGRRPFAMRSYEPNVGHAWGESPVSRLLDLQRATTSAFVSLLGDMALAGVHVEVDPSALHQDDVLKPISIQPRTVRMVKTTTRAGGGRAYNLFTVNTQIAAFWTQIDHFQAVAYEIVGIPRMALGQQAGAGTIGRTAGGVAAMLNQASKGVKQALRDLEKYVIEPVVQAVVDWELQWNTHEHPEFLGDVNVMARGLTGMIEQASKVDDLQWALQTLGSIADKANPDGSPVVPQDAIPRLVYMMFKARGVPTDGMFTQDYDTLGQLAGDQTAPMNNTTGGIRLDGRSPSAAAAIATANNPAGVPAAAPSGGAPPA